MVTDDTVLARAVFMLVPNGKLEREWPWADINAGEKPPGGDAPPAWLKNPKRRWARPQDPITLTGIVRRGHEEEARAWLGL